MRQNLYTCCRCGRQQRTASEQEEVPLGWAEICVERDGVEMIEGERQLQRATLDTHACSDCWCEVLDFLKKVVPDRDASVDDRFDKGAS